MATDWKGFVIAWAYHYHGRQRKSAIFLQRTNVPSVSSTEHTANELYFKSEIYLHLKKNYLIANIIHSGEINVTKNHSNGYIASIIKTVCNAGSKDLSEVRERIILFGLLSCTTAFLGGYNQWLRNKSADAQTQCLLFFFTLDVCNYFEIDTKIQTYL